MNDSDYQVSRNAKWAIAQTIISAGVLFFLYRYLLRELGAAKLGLWSLVLASTSLARLGELGFSHATLRFVGQYIGDGKPHAASEVLETSLLSISLPLMILAAVAIPVINLFMPWLVPREHIADATVIVPWAIAALWLGVTGGLVQSAIDGYGRMDQRNIVLIATNLLYLIVAVALVPVLGLKGVAIAQTVQAFVTLLVMWCIAKQHLKPLPMIPWRWRKNRFSEIARFAFTMQAGSIAGMFVEPVTKALITKFSGLEFLAYYDMANQVITRARSVLVSGFQAIIPEFAVSREQNTHRDLFLQSQKKVLDLGMPFMTLVMISFPLLSKIWIGHSEHIFVMSGQLLGITWLSVTLLMPAYFHLTGTGRGLPVAVAQIMTLIGTLALGWYGGKIDQEIGPILGATIALVTSNVYLYYQSCETLFSSEEHTRFPRWISHRIMVGSAVCLMVVGISMLSTKYIQNIWESMVVLLVLSLFVTLYALRSHKGLNNN